MGKPGGPGGGMGDQPGAQPGAGYDHYNLWTTDHAQDPSFALQDRSIDTIFIRPAVKVNPAVKVGVNASYSFINFKDSTRSDGDGLLVGPFIECRCPNSPTSTSKAVSAVELRSRQQLQ